MADSLIKIWSKKELYPIVRTQPEYRTPEERDIYHSFLEDIILYNNTRYKVRNLILELMEKYDLSDSYMSSGIFAGGEKNPTYDMWRNTWRLLSENLEGKDIRFTTLGRNGEEGPTWIKIQDHVSSFEVRNLLEGNDEIIILNFSEDHWRKKVIDGFKEAMMREIEKSCRSLKLSEQIYEDLDEGRAFGSWE